MNEYFLYNKFYFSVGNSQLNFMKIVRLKKKKKNEYIFGLGSFNFFFPNIPLYKPLRFNKTNFKSGNFKLDI